MCTFIRYNIDLVFNSDTDEQSLVSDIDFWASTDDTTYPIAEKTRNSNFALSRITAKIMRFDRTWKHVSSNLTTIPIATTDILAGIDNYSFASTHLKISRVRMEGSDGVMRTLKAVDRRKVSDDILNSTSGEPEFYDKLGNSILPMPVPSYGAVAGLEVEYQPGADYFIVTDTSKEPGFNPDFHRLVSLYAARDYCALHARDRLNVIDLEIQRIEDDMKAYFESRDIDYEPGFAVKKSSRGISLLF